MIGLQVYNITRQFGAESAQGAAMVLAIVREAGPLGTTFMMAAAGGTAITADLGSRTVRDEIAAMRVMAVDPIHRLVVPRVLGAAIATVLLTGIVIVGGIFGGYFYAVVIKGSNSGAYFQGFTTLAQLPDLYLALVKGSCSASSPRSSRRGRGSTPRADRPASAWPSTAAWCSRCCRSSS